MFATVARRLCVLLALSASSFGTLQSGSPQTFRATAELVAVRASVREGGTPLRTLTARDFVVLDNGEPQPVEAVDAATVPLDIAVLVGQSSTAFRQQDDFRRELAEIPTLVHAPDRLALTIVADNEVELIPLGGSVAEASLPLRPGEGVSFDEIARALMAPVPAGRQRSVLVVDTHITSGSLSYQAILRLAQSTPTRLDVALTGWNVTDQGMPSTTVLRRREFVPSLDYDESRANLYSQWHRSGNDAFYKFRDQHLRDMAALAEATGGGTLGWRGGSLRSAVDKSLDEIRTGYLLYFRPSPSGARGWHQIAVTVPSRRGVRVSARSGYIR